MSGHEEMHGFSSVQQGLGRAMEANVHLEKIASTTEHQLLAMDQDFEGVYAELVRMHSFLEGRMNTITQARGRLEVQLGQASETEVRAMFGAALLGTSTTADADIRHYLTQAEGSEASAREHAVGMAVKLVQALGHIANARDLMGPRENMTVIGHGYDAAYELQRAGEARTAVHARANQYLEQNQ